MKYTVAAVAAIFLLSSSAVFAAKPDNNPGKGGGEDFEPIPGLVCIDPGHGGTDTGAVNADLLEKNVNLKVAFFLQDRLKAGGYTATLTRTDDSTLSNADRYSHCNNERAEVLISIHHNGSSDPSVDYSLALYMTNEDVPLAQTVVDTVSAQLELPNKGVSKFASGVLLKSKMPATISEGFFLTNSTEYNLIKNGTRLEDEADALFDAITAYFAANP
ncbi:MAG: hypothetical protein A2864_01945 [Candidatus Woykebacteria bacterium RIFCSPHIGHO2_01_FULL_39_12]|uniref:MurNAc-LAA domain-containing protein n=1 Tax=Candidatus Woykebacteria bacterium RIFCSPHIGHO2_01_FULL_39_12 TaxID=1802599 RepID=A0A1G1WLQ1_9BACT|nr:MAG: hypothetical protein A2864_01945 [Candidatus Woykebacteria bacterium RIFCSPHIGHO2_01_FULL_39_12]